MRINGISVKLEQDIVTTTTLSEQPIWKRFLLNMTSDRNLGRGEGYAYGKFFNGTFYAVGPTMDYGL